MSESGYVPAIDRIVRTARKVPDTNAAKKIESANAGLATRAAGLPIARPLLHACRLALVHPLTGARLDLSCEYPQDFRDALMHLRRLDTISPSR